MAIPPVRYSIRNMISASMGIYVFSTKVLIEELLADAADPEFQRTISAKISCRSASTAAAWWRTTFIDINAKAARYWRDVGTLDAYYEANMDLVAVSPEFNLYDTRWPIRMRAIQAPPAKFVFAMEGQRMGMAVDSIVSPGCIVSGGRVNRSVLAPFVRVNSYSEVDESILMPRVDGGQVQQGAARHHR